MVTSIYIFTFVLIILLIFVNGLTDAPNAIATLVGTKVMPFKKAAYMSAIFEFIGVIVMSFLNLSVAGCISTMIDLQSGNLGVLALSSALISVILFSVVALFFGIPTSESHGLIAGLTGTAIAIGGLNGVNFEEWKNVLIGLAWSLVGGFFFGYFIIKIVRKAFLKVKDRYIEKAQICSACGMSFMHGAQDGQKFIGILIILDSIARGADISYGINPMDYIWMIFICAVTMAFGASVGGYRIVKTLGEDMVLLSKKQAFSTDIATIIILLISSLCGLPVSTTHAKTISIIGVGKSDKKKVNDIELWHIVKVWVYTFPICGLISYLITKLFMIF